MGAGEGSECVMGTVSAWDDDKVLEVMLRWSHTIANVLNAIEVRS